MFCFQDNVTMTAQAVRVQPAVAADAYTLAPILRDADRAEIAANTGNDPVVSLLRGIEHKPGMAWSAFDDEGIVCIFGVGTNPQVPTIGHPWMLASDRLMKHRVTFLRQCQSYITEMSKGHERLVNVVDARNTAHIRWLQWVGFDFNQRIDAFGVEKRPFHLFTKRVL